MSHTKVKWIIGLSLDEKNGNWPCYRLRDMINPQDPVEIEANRCLIEAAPETAKQRDKLLAALKTSKRMIDHRGHPDPVCVDGAFPTEDGCDQCQWCDEYQQIESAIKE